MTRATDNTAGTVVIADDVEGSIDFLRSVLEREGYVVHAAMDGDSALALVADRQPDIVLTDVMMPGINGYELCRRLKTAPDTRLIPVVLITSLGDRKARIEGINAGADDFLSKPVDLLELRARVRALVRLKRFTDDLDSAESMILSLGRTVEARDALTRGHCERMATYAVQFGEFLRLSDDELAALHRGGYLHDVGKIGLPDAILLKPGPLTAHERRVMEEHTTIGDALMADLRILRGVRPIVRHHHERYDGSGYPDGLSGAAIPLLAQVTSIVDIFDALTSDRVYRRPMSPDEATLALVEEAGRGWRDPALVDEFVAMRRANKLAMRQPTAHARSVLLS